MNEGLLRTLFLPPISSDPPHLGAKLAWIVRLRWVAICAQLLSILPALHYEILDRPLLPIYLGIVGALAALNATTWATLRRQQSVGDSHILVQLSADVIALSSLLALTGGAWNPLVPILFVHTGLGALLLEGRAGFLFIALLVGCLAVIQAYSHIPPGLRDALVPAEILFPAQLLVALAFWILTSWLSLTLSALQRQFAAMGERQTRIDRLRAVGALAAGLSHELATPLNTAQLKLGRLARTRDLETDADLATASEALDRCREVLRHMAGSQLRPEGFSLQMVDVGQLVEEVCTSASQDEPGAEILVRSSVRRGQARALLPYVAFSQAILNLIDNALESSEEGGAVEIEVRQTIEHTEIAVMDRGRGWPDVVRRHLGEPFITTKVRGVGLGLYYVYTLAEAVGAGLKLEDREGGGAVARLLIPRLAGRSETHEH